MSEETSTRVTIPTFKGNPKDFATWWTRWEAYAGLKGFGSAIQEAPDTNLPQQEALPSGFDQTTADGKAVVKALEDNRKAVFSFTMALQSDALMAVVHKSKNTAFPNGLAWKITQSLFTKYRPTDEVAGVEFKRALQNITMQEDESPSKLFEKISSTEARFKKALTMDDIMTIVYDVCPTKYIPTIRQEQRAKGTGLTVEMVEECMMELWRLIHNRRTDKTSAGKEVSLSTVDTKKSGNNGRKCYECGSTEHLLADCPHKKKNGGGGKRRENRTCNLCGRRGHLAAACFRNPANKDKVPDWYKAKYPELGLAANNKADEHHCTTKEVQLMAVDANLPVRYDADDTDDASSTIPDLIPRDELQWDTSGDEDEDDGEIDVVIDNSQDWNNHTLKYLDISTAYIKKPLWWADACEDSEDDEEESEFELTSLEEEEEEDDDDDYEADDEGLEPVDMTTYLNVDNKSVPEWSNEAECMSTGYFKDAEYIPEAETPDASTDMQLEVALIGGSSADHREVTALNFAEGKDILHDPNVWIGDSGATVHMTAHKDGLQQDKNTAGQKTEISVANGTVTQTDLIGTLRGVFCDKTGQEYLFGKLKGTAYVEGPYNLFSLSKCLNEGWTMSGNTECIKLTKGDTTIRFDIKVHSPKGVLYAAYFKRDMEVGNQATDQKISMSIQQAHHRLGHINEDATRATAKHLGWTITRGTLGPCESCSIGKAKQKNLPQGKYNRSKTTDPQTRRVFLDISSVKPVRDAKNTKTPYWRIIVHEGHGLKHSNFYSSKNGMIEPTCEKFYKWQQEGRAITHLRMDNAGENKQLSKRMGSKDWKLATTIEYTARDTPQQNSAAEVAFATIANRGRAIMTFANVPMAIRYLLYPYAFKTATELDGLTVVEWNGVTKTRYEHEHGNNPAFVNHLKTWGEAGTVKTRGKTTPKMSDRGEPCMMIGYAQDHPGDTYLMWSPSTGRVKTTRDVIWLKRLYFNKKVPEKLQNIPDYKADTPEDEILEAGRSVGHAENANSDNRQDQSFQGGGGNSGWNENLDDPDSEPDESEEDIELLENDGAGDNEGTAGVQTRSTTTRSGRRVRNNTRYTSDVDALQGVAFEYLSTEETALVGAGLGGGFTNTQELHVMKFKEAMKKDPVGWQDAVDKEHDRFVKAKCFGVTKMEDVPEGANIIDSTWAMKKKASGVLRARLNARGFKQIDGVDYNEHSRSSPVVNEITILMIFVLIIMANWWAELLDIKGAFLHGDFEPGEKVYMKVPEGFEKWYPGNVVLLLLKTIYGTRQAALAFWRKLLAAFRLMQYGRSTADPCLYYKWTEYGVIIWISWVDDCLITGTKDAVVHAKKQMMEQFDCDEIGEMKEYIGCKIDRTEDSIKITQPVLMQSYTDEFDLSDIRAPATPVEPGLVQLQKQEGETPLDAAEQKIYRSGVGKLLHMMKKSRPDILNPVRELSKFMQEATPRHMRAMKRTMAYCVATATRGWLLKPTRKWNGKDSKFEFRLHGRSDANMATDTDTRRSISGWSTFLEDAPISARSKQQEIIALSVTEAELIAAVCCAQDLVFEMNVLESIGLKVQKPMILYIDNKGAVDLANSWSVGGRTRHMDCRVNWLRELKEKGILLCKWESSLTMSSDLFTKNLGGALFNRFTKVYCGEDKYHSSKSSKQALHDRINGHDQKHEAGRSVRASSFPSS